MPDGSGEIFGPIATGEPVEDYPEGAPEYTDELYPLGALDSEDEGMFSGNAADYDFPPVEAPFSAAAITAE